MILDKRFCFHSSDEQNLSMLKSDLVFDPTASVLKPTQNNRLSIYIKTFHALECCGNKIQSEKGKRNVHIDPSVAL